MHVLGLPPAFVLSQDQTLRLKVRFLDRLGGYQSPRNLRNGHLHTLTRTRCRAHAMVMALENADSPESRRSYPVAGKRISPGLRRLRFPFFNYHLSKSARQMSKPVLRTSFETTRPPPDSPERATKVIESASPVQGREAMNAPHRTRAQLISSKSPCQHLHKKFSRGASGCTHPYQNRDEPLAFGRQGKGISPDRHLAIPTPGFGRV